MMARRLPLLWLSVVVLQCFTAAADIHQLTASDLNADKDFLSKDEFHLLTKFGKLHEGGAQLGETNKLTPEEEAAALQAEDHDANIKRIEAQEMAKAKIRASGKSEKVPESVECYWKMEQQSLDQKALSEKYSKLGKAAHEKFDMATKEKEASFTKVQALKKRSHQEHTAMAAAQRSYKLEHTKGMNAYDTAKGNLDNYNVERKKVDMDASRSKSVLATYLKYKKLFIESSADAHSPAQSREVQQYKKLSSQYLKSYHALQAKIKESYGAATKYQALYNELSKRYQKMAADASEIAGEVAKLGDALGKTKLRLNKEKDAYEKHTQAANRFEAQWKAKHAQSLAAYDKYQALAARVIDSKANYFKMTAMANRYTELGNTAKRKAELNQVRYLNFDNDAKKSSTDIEAAIKKAALLKRKYEAANAAGAVFTKSYRESKCDSMAEKEKGKESKLFTLALVQLPANIGEGSRQRSKETAKSASQCASDKALATTNLEAAERSQLQHKQELTYLHMLREEHETAVSGSKTAKAIRDASRTKAERYHKVGESAKEDSLNPCV